MIVYVFLKYDTSIIYGLAKNNKMYFFFFMKRIQLQLQYP